MNSAPAPLYKFPQSRWNRFGEAVFLLGLPVLVPGGFIDSRCLPAGAVMMLVGGIIAAKTDRRTPEEILRDLPES